MSTDRPKRGGCLQPLVVWVISAFSLWATAYLVPGFEIDGFFPRAFVAALVLGLLNAVVRPLLIILTLPVTVITLGLFLLVINASMIGLSAWLLEGFSVSGAGPALLGAIVLAVVNGLVSWVLEPKDRRRPRAEDDVIDM